MFRADKDGRKEEKQKFGIRLYQFLFLGKSEKQFIQKYCNNVGVKWKFLK